MIDIPPVQLPAESVVLNTVIIVEFQESTHESSSVVVQGTPMTRTQMVGLLELAEHMFLRATESP